jgi:hypothetical protein
MTRWMVATLLAVSLPALAQTKSDSRSTQPEASQRVTTMTFGDGDLIESNLQGPDLQMIDSRPEIQHSSLIRVRADFDAEVMKSAEQL